MQLTAGHPRSHCLAGKVLPIEILPLGEFDPVYRSTLDVQNGELPVLPLSIYGAVRPLPHGSCPLQCQRRAGAHRTGLNNWDMHPQPQLVLHHLFVDL